MNEKKTPLWLAMIFIIYTFLMIWLLFFFYRSPIFSDLSYVESMKCNINLTPFSTISRYIHAIKNGRITVIALINLLGNVVMFIPMGILLPTLWKRLRSFPLFMLCSVFTIMLIEITQLMTLRGSCDVDDLILNILGCISGFILCRLFRGSATAK